MDFPDTTAHAAMARALTEAWRARAEGEAETWLLGRAEALARDNVRQFHGGPFGALVVDLPSRTVLGAAANHATLHHDPTGHAEVLALREAAKQGADLSSTTLLTSCECCPMCLAHALQCGLRRILYNATRADAARAGFADAAQYALMHQPLEAQATYLPAHDPRLPEAQAALGKADAVVLVPGPSGLTALGHGQATPADAVLTAPIRALRAACAAWGHVRLPPGSLLITRHCPHPLSLLAADWANIGRGENLDAPEKDPASILYLHPTPEPLPGLPAEAMWHALRHPASALTLTHHPLPALEAFAAWAENLDKLTRY